MGKYFTIIIVVIIVVILYITVFVNMGKTDKNINLPQISKGTLDLTRWDFSNYEPLKLDGEWEFYWKQFLEPVDFNINLPCKNEFLQVPRSWNRYSYGTKFSPEAYATYRLVINTKPQDNILALRIPRILTAYKIWINNKLMSSCGVIGKNASHSKGRVVPNTIFFSNNSSTIQIVLQVSNFVENEAGITASFTFGESQKVLKERDKQIERDMFLFGLIFIIGCYHIIYYVFNRKNVSTLLFGVFCMIVGLRTITSGECVLLQLINVNESILFRLKYAIFGVGAMVLLTFYYTLFPQEYSKKVLRFFQVTNLIFVAVIMYFGISTSCNFIIVFECIGVISGLYTICVVILAYIHKRQSALIILGGTILFLSVITNDILNSEHIIGTKVLLIPIGLAVFIFVQSVVLALRFSEAFKNVEQLSERLIRSNRVKDNILANTSHELKTPLHGIIGISEYMLNTNLPTSAINNINKIMFSAKRLSNLVNDLLDYSKLKHNYIKLNLVACSLKMSVDFTIDMFQHSLSDVEIINNINNSFFVKADEGRLLQILQNLIGNAIKFTKKGVIKISAERKDDMIEVSISDSGPGIEEKDYKRIFKSFEQIDSSVHRKYGGAGLGLAITKKLLKEHGGEIWLTSEIGKGSTFIFTLFSSDKEVIPCATVFQSSSNNNIGEDRPAFNKFDKKPFKILIVDDDTININLVLNHLMSDGYECVSTTSAIKILDLIGKEKPHLILLDVMMPEVDGFQACKKIRQNYDINQLPIIFLTAKNQLSDLMNGFKIGGNDYIIKPFYKNELLARIETHLDLLTANHRLDNLYKFTNLISDIDDIKQLVLTAMDILSLDYRVKNVNAYFEKKPIGKSGTKRLDKEVRKLAFKENIEIIQKDKIILFFAKICNGFIIGIECNDIDTNIVFFKSILEQIQNTQNNIISLIKNTLRLKALSTIAGHLEDTYYIKADAKYSWLHTSREKIFIELQLGQIILFFHNALIRVHRSYLVNPLFVNEVVKNNKGSFDMVVGETRIPVGQKYKNLINENTIFYKKKVTTHPQ